MKAKKNGKGGVILELNPAEQQIQQPSAELDIQKILVPLDFSDCSRKALQYAAAFAKQSAADLHLLHVQESTPSGAETGYVECMSTAQAQAQLERYKEQLEETIEVATAVTRGVPYSEIVEYARTLGVDLIIISTHGRRGFQRLLMGSTVEKVVRHAPCPVLVVRELERDFIEAGRKS